MADEVRPIWMKAKDAGVSTVDHTQKSTNLRYVRQRWYIWT